MQNYVGIFRNEEDLQKGLGELEHLTRARCTSEGRRFETIQSRLASGARSQIDVDCFESRGVECRGAQRESWRAQQNRPSRLR